MRGICQKIKSLLSESPLTQNWRRALKAPRNNLRKILKNNTELQNTIDSLTQQLEDADNSIEKFKGKLLGVLFV